MDIKNTSAPREVGEMDENKANAPTPLSGKTLSFLDTNGGLCLNLSNDDLKDFIVKHNVPSIEQSASAISGYITVPHPVMDDQKRIKDAFDKCMEDASREKG